MMREKISLRLSNCFCCPFVALLILLIFVMVPFSQAEVARGKITSIRGNVMELDLGTEKGVRPGDPGRVCYHILIQGKEKSIFIAKFKITEVSAKSSVAQVEEKTGEVKIGHLVEVFLKGGELELTSNPSGGKIYVDGKERGETPSVLSDVKLGSHVIRIVKQGYEPYEEQVAVVEGERKKISASLKAAGGSLSVSTDPAGANIFIDGRYIGVSPFEGRDLSSGTHKVRAAKEGYDTWEQDVAVEAGKRLQVFAMLRESKSPTTPSSKDKPRTARVPDEQAGSRKSEPDLLSSLVDRGPALLRENDHAKLIEDISKLSGAERKNAKIMILESFALLKNWVLEKDKNSKVKWEILYKTLKRSSDRTATPLLIQIAKDPEEWTRLYAVALLGNMGDRRSLDDLRQIAANDSNPRIRKTAGKSISLIEKADKSPTKPQEKRAGEIRVDKNAKVYVGIHSGGGTLIEMNPAYKYFHKEDCKHLWDVSKEEMTAAEATARGKSRCPDCFR